jgi:hypothetical protein
MNAELRSDTAGEKTIWRRRIRVLLRAPPVRSSLPSLHLRKVPSIPRVPASPVVCVQCAMRCLCTATYVELKRYTGYTGDSLSLKIIIAFLLGLALYNAIELIIILFGTFQRYHGLYFWSLFVAAFGIIPYSLGFIIKFFQLLDPNKDEGYVAVVLLTIGWYPMITGKIHS